jgi:hypothetical protein
MAIHTLLASLLALILVFSFIAFPKRFMLLVYLGDLLQ